MKNVIFILAFLIFLSLPLLCIFQVSDLVPSSTAGQIIYFIFWIFSTGYFLTESTNND